MTSKDRKHQSSTCCEPTEAQREPLSDEQIDECSQMLARQAAAIRERDELRRQLDEARTEREALAEYDAALALADQAMGSEG